MQVDLDLRVPGDLTVSGNIKPLKAKASLLTQRDLTKYPIPLARFRIHDAVQTNLTGTANTDDLAIIGTAFGTDVPYLSAGDLKNDLGVTTRYARVQMELPADYQAAETVTIRVNGGMKTTVASASATVDIECYKSNRDGTKTGSDLCTTAAQSINSLTFADKDFQITATTLSPGDVLDIRIAIAVNDTATGTAVIGAAGAVDLLCDVI